MNIEQKLTLVTQNLSDEQLDSLLQLAVTLQNNNPNTIKFAEQTTSQAYQEWVSADNDIYDEIFADEITKG
jgi:cytoplasmic iron level regulating protein YaaA (DUF328/UPF0246 family)